MESDHYDFYIKYAYSPKQVSVHGLRYSAGSIAGLASGTLTKPEIDAPSSSEEEKMARDVYLQLNDLWGCHFKHCE
jgi:hypothetical protein